MDERAADEALISKKEVLELTGISYGQFYRWKRKGLIPEAWFARKSTFTGQETFLPRAKVLERIEKIKQLKDEYSLEQLAELLAPQVGSTRYSADELAAMDWISPETRAFYDELWASDDGYRFQDVLFLSVIERLRGPLSDEEIALTVSTLLDHEAQLTEDGEFRWTLVVARKGLGGGLARPSSRVSTSVCCLFDGQGLLDSGVHEAVRLNLHDVLEELKLKLSGLQSKHGS